MAQLESGCFLEPIDCDWGLREALGGDRAVKEGNGARDAHHKIRSPHEADENTHSTGHSLLLCLLIQQRFIEFLLCAGTILGPGYMAVDKIHGNFCLQ